MAMHTAEKKNKTNKPQMIRLIALSAALVFLMQFAVSQSFYARYHSAEGNKPALMQLIKTNNMLSAVLYIHNTEQNEWTRHDLSGQVTNEEWVLNAFDGSIAWSGTLQGDRLVLSNEAKDKQAFSFIASYPQGSVPLSYYHGNASKLLDEADIFSPKAAVETAYLWPVDNHYPDLKTALASLYGIRPEANTPPENIIGLEHERFFDQYRRMNADLAGTSASLNWERSQQVQVLKNDNNILTIELASYAFTGGAHGMANLRYMVYDLTADRQLTLNDILNETAFHTVTALIGKKVRQRYAIPQDQSLTDFGLFVNEVTPTENFFVTPLGIGFHYNNYDIAPYTLGQTTVFFSFEELEVIIGFNYLQLY